MESSPSRTGEPALLAASRTSWLRYAESRIDLRRLRSLTLDAYDNIVNVARGLMCPSSLAIGNRAWTSPRVASAKHAGLSMSECQLVAQTKTAHRSLWSKEDVRALKAH